IAGQCATCTTPTCSSIVACIIKGANTPRLCAANVSNVDFMSNVVATLHCVYDACAANAGPCANQYEAACFNQVKDGDETAIDCGGSLCLPCLPGASCDSSCDCMNKHACTQMSGGAVCCGLADGALVCH